MANANLPRTPAESGVAEFETSDARSALAAVFREEGSALTASIARILGDFAIAEEMVQDALVVALERWPIQGIPNRPGAWLLTVARRRAVDQLRRDARYRKKLDQLRWPLDQEPDDRLRLIFTCCHPALRREAQIALTLRAVCGFTTAQIARAFLIPEATITKRITRARHKIRSAGIPYRVPRDDELGDRVNEVLAVLYLMFNEGYLASSDGTPTRRDLAEESAWLTELLTRLLPAEPEPVGLLALMRLHLARASARFDEASEIVLLKDQDRSRWNREQIRDALALLQEAARRKRPGPYQLQAAIVACHAEAPSSAATDWPQILALYDVLLRMAPSPVVRLNRAVALREVAGAAAALEEVETLTLLLDNYHVFHSVRAELLAELGQAESARWANLRAFALTRNVAERSLLQRRLVDLRSSGHLEWDDTGTGGV